MRRKPIIMLAVYCYFLLSGSAYGLGEKILTLGSANSWDFAEKKLGITEASQIRPHPVLVLNEGGTPPSRIALDGDSLPDLALSFDEARPEFFADSQKHYDVFISQGLAAAAPPWNRAGSGAALFLEDAANEAPLVLRPRNAALFAPGSHIRDFSIEFWLFPLNVENGAQIVAWISSKADGAGAYINQNIRCVMVKSRYQWAFENFFFSPDGKNRKSISFSGPTVVPKTWSHHLVRFDADLGLLEYLVDGRLEALDYASSSGREGGEVFTPIVGEDCRFELGSRFAGIMDEFRIHRSYLENSGLARYAPGGGRMETRTLDLGAPDSQVIKVEAFGGLTSNIAGKVQNEYAGGGSLKFPDHAELRFFIRCSNSPYRWNDVSWIPVNPGAVLPDSMRGRYMQAAVDFYPGENGETAPYLAELRIVYRSADPPSPPSGLMAVAKDGAVELSWRPSPSRDTGGYLVYFGTARGEYFGEHAILGSEVLNSPFDAGNRTSIRIEGLRNGTLYYFAVASYGIQANGDWNHGAAGPWAAASSIFGPPPFPGEFSREVAVRPLRMAE